MGASDFVLFKGSGLIRTAIVRKESVAAIGGEEGRRAESQLYMRSGAVITVAAGPREAARLLGLKRMGLGG